MVTAKVGARDSKPAPAAGDMVGRAFTLWTPMAGGRGVLKAAGVEWEVVGPDMPAGSRVRVVEAIDSETLRIEAAHE